MAGEQTRQTRIEQIPGGFAVISTPIPADDEDDGQHDPWAKRRGRGRGESKHSPRILAAKLKQIAALEMRAGGATHAEIAAALGYRTKSGSCKAIRRALDEVAALERKQRQRARQREQDKRRDVQRWCVVNGCTPPNWDAIDHGDAAGAWLDLAANPYRQQVARIVRLDTTS